MNFNPNHYKVKKITLTFIFLTTIVLFCTDSSISSPIRIVVLPGYAEDGTNITANPAVAGHYRRVMRFINNQLVKHGFEVINPTAIDLPEQTKEYQVRHKTPMATCMFLNQKYGTDAAYIIWLNVRAKRSRDGFCKVTAQLDGEGYDSSGHDLGAGLSKNFKTIRRTCDEAVSHAEKEIGYLVGRVLTAHQTQ